MGVTIIIPTFNEAKALPATLENIINQRNHFETIVVDGGSTDATRQIASSSAWVKLVTADLGRALQMNAGATVARGEWLLFLHADTLLPDEALVDITSLSSNSAIQTGCFRHSFSGDNYFLSLISRLHNWRFSRGGIIYGDQAFFIRKELFNRVGGFPLVPILEDVQFSEQLVKITWPIMLGKTVITDSRKFIQRGIIRSFIEVVIILTCYELKLPIKARGFFSPTR